MQSIFHRADFNSMIPIGLLGYKTLIDFGFRNISLKNRYFLIFLAFLSINI